MNNRNQPTVMNLQGMTRDEIKHHCPVAFQTKASNAVSENYTFIPTSNIIDDMDKLGWKVGQATSVRSRKNAGYQKHLIKFFNPSIEINGDDGLMYPQILLTNSHDGKSSFKFEAGIFRLVCSNGLVIKTEDYGTARLVHKGYSFEAVQKLVKEFEETVDEVLTRITAMKKVQLTKEQQIEFAKQAALLRFKTKSYNEDTKEITKKLINCQVTLDEHVTIMNETDRTIVSLLWHENIIDVIGKQPKEQSIPFYLTLLSNMCFADYIDRITFQKQIWQFNEMSSLVKTFKNNSLYHELFQQINAKKKNKQKFNPTEVRFTKVLTKYSTEYNNSIFIQNLCQQLAMDKKDMFAFFLDIKNKYPAGDSEILSLFENYEISKLDINRIYRYLDKYTKEDAEDTADIVVLEDEHEAD